MVDDRLHRGNIPGSAISGFLRFVRFLRFVPPSTLLFGLRRAPQLLDPEGEKVPLPFGGLDHQLGTLPGQRVALHYRADFTVDPVKALRAWLKAAAISAGPVFRMARGVTVGTDGLNSAAVSRVTKEAAERAGLNPAGYSAHSLRAGFVSECDRRHIPNGAVRAVTRHTSDAMLAVYDRPGELFSGSAGAYFEGV